MNDKHSSFQRLKQALNQLLSSQNRCHRDQHYKNQCWLLPPWGNKVLIHVAHNLDIIMYGSPSCKA